MARKNYHKQFVVTTPEDGSTFSLSDSVIPITGFIKVENAHMKVLINGIQHFCLPVPKGSLQPSLLIPPWMTPGEWAFTFQFFVEGSCEAGQEGPVIWEITRHVTVLP